MVGVVETVTMGAVTALVGVVPVVGVLLMNDRRSTVIELVVGLSEVRVYPDMLGYRGEESDTKGVVKILINDIIV